MAKQTPAATRAGSEHRSEEMPVSEHVEAAAAQPRDAAQLLRAAAEELRRSCRLVPRGPWRWGDPDVGDGPDSDPVPRHELWPHPPGQRPNPLEERPPLGHRDPFGPSPSEWPPLHPGVHQPHSHQLDPEVAEPLAALLDVLAERLERDDEVVDPRTRLTAVSLARSVLHSASGPDLPTARLSLRRAADDLAGTTTSARSSRPLR